MEENTLSQETMLLYFADNVLWYSYGVYPQPLAGGTLTHAQQAWIGQVIAILYSNELVFLSWLKNVGYSSSIIFALK